MLEVHKSKAKPAEEKLNSFRRVIFIKRYSFQLFRVSAFGEPTAAVKFFSGVFAF